MHVSRGSALDQRGTTGLDTRGLNRHTALDRKEKKKRSCARALNLDPPCPFFLFLDKPPAFLEEAAGPRYVVEVDMDAPPLVAGREPPVPGLPPPGCQE